jgi:hypothetical protein
MVQHSPIQLSVSGLIVIGLQFLSHWTVGCSEKYDLANKFHLSSIICDSMRYRNYRSHTRNKSVFREALLHDTFTTPYLYNEHIVNGHKNNGSKIT